jgi:hypothetical protein
MEGDIKEVVGALMRVLGGGEISREDVDGLAFDATGDLLLALNEAYIRLLEFAYDRDARRNDLNLDREMRLALQRALDEIIQLSDAMSSSS